MKESFLDSYGKLNRSSLKFSRWLILLMLCLALSGCGDQIVAPSFEELIEFENSGPVRQELDVERLLEATAEVGPYEIVAGDVLEVTMPEMLQNVTLEQQADNAMLNTKTSLCRVDEDGCILLPVVGEVKVMGKSAGQVDEAIASAYYPRYSVRRPLVYTRVAEYAKSKVQILGEVVRPGVYQLASDEMSVVSLLMAAGGITENGAASIKVVRNSRSVRSTKKAQSEKMTVSDRRLPDDIKLSFIPSSGLGTKGLFTIRSNGKILWSEQLDIYYERERQLLVRRLEETFEDEKVTGIIDKELGELASKLGVRSAAKQQATELSTGNGGKLMVLPIKGQNIPFADMALEAGDRVIVERLEQPMFTVVGLVERPGNFPYPPDAKYTLMQAVAFAGGFDPVAEPRYVTIYRLKDDGRMVHVTYKIAGEARMTEAIGTLIKPGDIVAVEHTPRTRSNVILDRLFRINFGVYAPFDAFND